MARLLSTPTMRPASSIRGRLCGSAIGIGGEWSGPPRPAIADCRLPARPIRSSLSGSRRRPIPRLVNTVAASSSQLKRSRPAACCPLATGLEVETRPSLAPSTAARSNPMRWTMWICRKAAHGSVSSWVADAPTLGIGWSLLVRIRNARSALSMTAMSMAS